MVELIMMEDVIPSGSFVDVRADDDMSLSQEARHARWQSKRPSIDHLKDGVVEVEGTMVPLFNVGDRIVVDCCTNLLKNSPWLETIVGRVRSIDDDTGLVSVFDEASDVRSPVVRWASFKDGLHTLKLAPARGNPLAAPEPTSRPEKTSRFDDQGNPKRGKGRPRGSKNRPKDVIMAEKVARKGSTT
jgi:hypothetical protein